MDQNLEDTIIKLASIGLEWVLLVRFLLFPDHLFLGCLLGFFLLLGFFFRDASRDWSGQGGKWTTMNFHCERRYKRQYSLVFIGDLFRGCCWELFWFFFGERGGGVAPSTNRPAPSGLPPAESNKFRNGIVSKKGRPVSDSVLFFVLFCFVLFFFTQCFSFSFYDDDDDRSVSFSKRLRIARSSSSSSSSSRTPRKEKKTKETKHKRRSSPITVIIVRGTKKKKNCSVSDSSFQLNERSRPLLLIDGAARKFWPRPTTAGN